MKERFYNQRNLTRRLTQLLVLFALLFIPIGTWAQGATAVEYREFNKGKRTFQLNYQNDPSLVNNQTTEMGEAGNKTWYAVYGNISIPERITVIGDVNLVLCDGSQLSANEGITVPSGSSLTIYAQSEGDTAGSLSAIGYEDYNGANIYGAAIGAKYDNGTNTGCGSIFIHGGKINANASEQAPTAGIGGCFSDGGTVEIYGGSVSASGGGNAAGIGGGANSNGGTVEIYGGSVSAYGGTGIANSGYGEAQAIGAGSSNGTSSLTSGTFKLGTGVTCYGDEYVDPATNSLNPVYGPIENVDTRYRCMDTRIVNYGLWVGDLQVTSVNASNILGDENSTVSFTPATTTTPNTPNTLTLNGANLTNTYFRWIGDEGLNVKLIGRNSVTNTDKIFNNIAGGANISFSKGDDNSECSLTLTTDSDNPIGGFYNSDNPDLGTFEMFGGYPDDTWIIATNYNLSVAGKQVTSANASNVFDDATAKVSYAYDATNNKGTLSLNGAELTGNIIWNNNYDLYIALTGTNSIIHANDSSTIIRSEKSYARLFFTKTEDASLELQHKDEGTSAPSIISGFRAIDYTTNGLYIASDIPTKYASKTIVTSHTLYSLVGLLNDNCIHAATITSVESYPLWIAGTQITANNNASTGITGTGITGTVTYEPNNNKLTLSSATIEYETGTAIVWTDPTNALTVYLIGNNTIDSRDNKTGQIAFQGNGSDLNFNTGSSPGSLLLMSNKNPYGIADFDAGFYHVDFGALSFDNLTSGNWTESQISYHYPLIIANKQVTSANYNTIRSGTVTFDPTTTTLTLHGNGDFDLTGGDDSPYTAVESGFDNLNVYLEGATSILCRGTNDVAFKGTVSGAKVTFTTNASSPGSLYVAASATKMFTDITPEYDGLMYFDTGTRDYLNQVKNENVTLSTGKIMKAPWEGSGTTGDPFLIKTVDDLKNLAAQVGIASNKVFKLNNNISLSGVDDFEPIGEYSGSPFKGTFDGDGNTISGLIYEDTGNMYAAGLFAYVGDANTAGTIKNLVLENCSFSGGNGNIGAVVGSLVNGTIDNCTVTSCTITRADVMNINAGGIAGSITTGTVKNCIVDGTTTITAQADDKGTAYAGAIYGSASGAAAAPTLTNNYYYYTVQTSTKVGSADAEVKSSNEERGIGDDDDADGAKLYTKALTVQGLSDGDEYVFKEFYNKTTVNYYYAPGTIVSLEIYPKEAYALTTVSLTAGSQTDNLDNTSTTGYTYQFTMPDADGTINVTSAINLASTNITCEIGAANYDGTAQVPTTVNATGIPGTTGATELTKDTHFTIKGYKLNGEPVTSPIDAGNYTVTIEGKGDYTGSKDVSYTINKASLANAAITKLTVGSNDYTGDNIEIQYTGEAIHPTVTVTINDGTITVDPSEYTVSYGDSNTNVNGVDEWASVKITSTGKNFTAGTYTAKDFKIVAAAAIIKGSNETVTYNGAAQAYSQGTIDKGTLVVTYYTSEDNRTNGTNGTTDAPTDANTYYVLLTQGNTNYTADPKNATFTINPKTLTDDMVTLSPESFEYNGAIQKPEVTVADGTALTGDDYTIENNGGKDVDTYNVVVTAKRNYIGKVTKTFKITNRKLKATDVTFNAHWASYYNSTEDVDLPEGIAAYVVTSVGETTATATQISYIPAGVPVLLQDEVTTTTTNTSADGNMMAHATDDVTVASLGGTIYGLYNGKLMRVASGTIPAGKNYIKVSQPNAARQLSIVIGEGGATAIMTLEMDEENDTDEWYTLDGRKLQRKPVKNGLYLQNGKKVVINNK